MSLDRRQLLVGAAASAFLATSCSAQAVPVRVSPEGFGAVGDGVTDDYDAMQRLVAAVNAAGGGTITLQPGRTYFLNRYIANGQAVADLIFANCRALTLEGNGATIAVKGDFARDDAATHSLAGLRFQDCRQVIVRNLVLNGNVDRTTRSGKITESPSHGLVFQSCSDVLIDGVNAHHFASDGMIIRDSKRTGLMGTRLASRQFTVRNSRFLFNARQGLSVTQLRGGLFENCDFSYTGFVDANGTVGPYGNHSPSAGVDVEPNNTPVHGDRMDVLSGDLTFRNCRMIGNFGAAFLAAKSIRGMRFFDQVTLDGCQLECGDGLTGGRDGFIFDAAGGSVLNCTLRLRDKTAYVGWYADSDASFRFVGNTVSGRRRGPGNPLLVVRNTGGAPTVESNRFVAEPPLGDAPGPWLIKSNNPKAVVRNNQFLASGAR